MKMLLKIMELGMFLFRTSKYCYSLPSLREIFALLKMYTKTKAHSTIFVLCLKLVEIRLKLKKKKSNTVFIVCKKDISAIQ